MATTNNNDREYEVEQAVWQFLDAQLRNSAPDIEELVKKYPEFEDRIRKKITDFQKVDSLFDSLVQADESDFAYMSDEYDLIGKNVGSFKIEEIIGRGGMGVVYLAHDTRLDRSVAVKSIPAELQASSIAQTRFKREAKLLASLNHPNIAVIYEIIEQQIGASYLVLEYVPGQTLAQRIANKPLKLEEALSIGQQVAEAISSAHEKGVVHRDLKPGNIKITPEGKVKVLDFGLAKVSIGEDESVDNTVTQPGRVMGTPAYMSPEQARGKQADKRSDIWSFGCIMYQMLTGELPFEGGTVTDTLARIIERQPDWEKLPQDTPTNIRTLLRRCLEKKQQRRLQHIGDAVIEINETLNMPITAPPVTTPSSTLLKPQITDRHKLRTAATIVAVFVVVFSVIAVKLVLKQEVPPSSKEIRLVVLPFENLGSTEDEYFAEGITDAITARLAGIHGLSVLSRQSSMQYKKSEKNPQQIAEELSVDYILEGTVQRERPSDPTSRVRIIPQLIKASEDAHVWTEIYDDDMKEVFRLQSDIAEQVAQALDVALIEPERRALASRPTENTEAYEYYLQGENYYSRRGQLESDCRIAIRMLERAVELDPGFALAYAKLCQIHSHMYGLHYDHSQERRTVAKQAVDKALQLDPDLPEAHFALGRYYSAIKDSERALEQYAIVLKSQPNHTGAIAMTGYTLRDLGKLEQTVTNFKRVLELNPRNPQTLYHVGDTLFCLRNYPEAERYYNRAISLAPDRPGFYWEKAWLYLSWEGSTEKARAVLAEALQNIDSTEDPFINLFCTLDMFDRNYQGALDRLSLKSEDISYVSRFTPTSLLHARIYGYMGKKELAKKCYDEARSILESTIEQDPEQAQFHSSLGIAYAGLVRKEDAVREGKLAVEMLPIGRNTMGRSYCVEDLARIYVMVGEFDAAFDQLEHLLSIPGRFSIHLLQLDPAWDPLRNHPRFKKLIDSDK